MVLSSRYQIFDLLLASSASSMVNDTGIDWAADVDDNVERNLHRGDLLSRHVVILDLCQGSLKHHSIHFELLVPKVDGPFDWTFGQ